MYLNKDHVEHDVSSLQKFITDNPLGMLISAIKSPNFPTIQCTHIPWVLDVAESTEQPGTLRGHLARVNPHSKSMIEAVKENSSSNGYLEEEVTVIFNGPAHHYVTPSFYTKTKPDTGKVVPTWNYAAVQATGRAKIFWDTKNESSGSFLQQQVIDLSAHGEKHIMKHTGGENPAAWEVSDAPTSYVEILKKAIIGIEIELHLLEGKHKMSQEMGAEDRKGVAEGFKAMGTDVGLEIARTVEERGARKDAAKKIVS